MGFILIQIGWWLSPLYDANTIPYSEYLALNVSEDDSFIDIDLAIVTAEYYGIKENEAEKIGENRSVVGFELRQY